MNKMFRPSGDKNFHFRYGREPNYNWCNRYKNFPAEKCKQFSVMVFSKLHYLSAHAPQPVRAKWRLAATRFENRKFGNASRQSMNYANTYTAHAWL